MGATAINYTSLAFPLSLSKCHPLCAPTQVEHFLAVAEAGPFCGFLLPRTICPAAVTSDAERGITLAFVFGSASTPMLRATAMPKPPWFHAIQRCPRYTAN